LVAIGVSVLLGAVLLRAIDMGKQATEVEAAQHEHLAEEGGP
jgi:hypothetical protein